MVNNEIDKTFLREIKKKAKSISPLVRIGKSGLTNSLIDEIILQLKKNKLVKVKMLKSALNEGSVKKMAQEISISTGSILVDVIGLNAVFYSKLPKKRKDYK